MGYCKFENTSQDLQECVDNWELMKERNILKNQKGNYIKNKDIQMRKTHPARHCKVKGCPRLLAERNKSGLCTNHYLQLRKKK